MKKILQKTDKLLTANNFHLIGIGGDGMSALAGLLISLGKNVSGSEQQNLDRVKQKGILDDFKKSGVNVYYGHDANKLPRNTEVVIYSSIISSENPEIVEAKQRGLLMMKRSVALGQLMSGKVGISISGGAGKSTTTAMTGFALEKMGVDPTIYVGARMINFENKNYRLGKGKFFVAEADEFDRSFLDLTQECAVITNIFFADHVDYYSDIEETRQSFVQFLRQSKRVIVNGDQPIVLQTAIDSGVSFETFGLKNSNNWSANNIHLKQDITTFDVYHDGKKVANGSLFIPGKHNILNSLAAIAALAGYGFSPSMITDALASYRGIGRRFEQKGVINGVTFFDDYGHNRIQIDATIEGLRQIYPNNNIYAIFQPRQFKRTKLTLPDIVKSFNSIKAISVLDISYGIGDTEEDKNSIHSGDIVKALTKVGKTAVYNADFNDAVNWLKKVIKPGDVVITLGTGNPYIVTDLLFSEATS